MFQASATLFFYAISPVHAGAGTALGVIDNPIQRERHTDFPIIAGSGIKGAIRHHFWAEAAGNPPEPVQSEDATDKDGTKPKSKVHTLVERIFGPDSQSGEGFAGAISFGDAQLVAFPVRSIKGGFVYATCPLALARLQRLLTITGQQADWTFPDNSTLKDKALCAGAEPLLNADTLVLETFTYKAKTNDDVKALAKWLAQAVFGKDKEGDYFHDKLANELVVLSDDDLSYFVRNATVVEPHVRINDETGTADDGGLFYTENLPPETLLATALFASKERTSDNQRAQARAYEAEDVMRFVLEGDGQKHQGLLDSKVIQLGGDATTGRGLVQVSALQEQGGQP
ncbi:type III-B CRISPR module RAMP protein Cmr4 [Pokkaliibacter sp. MBI-7]|uniref:type III-B CRISPR module RAMP protein Cmr4 n=1 Tax=Pokkaliibacter sp. MBI-7 TaxID=3040600 RepID=UPI00244A2D0C|nr:type III-B CRISPR module RAMP protein Cmr4 [Pokkaliibacter sp. MBI-7]MDH2431442.1 type III-B CRISPR module RAMP protein Cmr4 [Pokkaliibacter sp. MBI-7]